MFFQDHFNERAVAAALTQTVVCIQFVTHCYNVYSVFLQRFHQLFPHFLFSIFRSQFGQTNKRPWSTSVGRRGAH